MSDTDILIIGGGIAGVSTAYHLSNSGCDVTLLERGEIASEASGVNAGHIGAIGWGNVPTLNSHLTMGSLEIFKKLQLDLGYDIEYWQSGALEAIHTEEQYQYARDRVLSLRSQGYRVELLTNREARGMEPGLNPGLPGFVYMPLRSQANPVKATQALAAATASGANIKTGHQVTSLLCDDNGVYRIETNQGEFHANRLVIAAGAWCGPVGRMLGLRIPIVPVRGQMWGTEILPPRIFHTISSVESEYFWHHYPGNDSETPPELTHKGEHRLTRHLYGRQTREGEIIFGGDRQLVGYHATPDLTGIETNKGHASEVLPLLQGLPIKRTWAGLMSFSLDGRPLIGKIPQFDNLYVVSGLCSSGFGRGPMAGKLLAEYLDTGARPSVLDGADPGRCVTPVEQGGFV
jgi:sarcosine oxidase subunit beta